MPERPNDTSSSEDCHRFAELLVRAWYSAGDGGRLDVPLSVASALMLVRPADMDVAGLKDWLGQLTPGPEIATRLRHVWRRFGLGRPDLWPAAHAMLTWLWTDHNGQNLRGAQAMVQAAIRHGIIDWICDPARSGEADLLGALWSQLHTSGSRSMTGQFFTPMDVADLMVSISIPPVRPGMTVHDVAIGTGGLFRAVAQRMRASGFDPTGATWIGVDADPLAIAACAVNAHLWGLGRNVLLGVGDVLAGDVLEQAGRARREAIRARDAAVLGARLRADLAALGLVNSP
ncbi:SAM-dependent methyltransferase [Crossiella sp. SN42]|uniref:N-6 DNA methylase n=1 Tax=Crossiella sp. SN42 TaxID=2944808 RepID=UPI00207C6935|nr:N-6 DNA methylase [Crossiella sp. SN42]MCO1580532.1 SAM-dependent methyltransferase [Crossiella sp. SN42]